MLTSLVLAGSLLLPSPTPDVERAVTAQRVSAARGAPAIDGRLDDAIWASTDSISDFVQMEPQPGEPARFRTVARFAFDDQAVYVAVRAYDAEPHRIMAQLTRRDQDSPSDWLMVGLDSRRDRRTAYVFGVNPVGVKRDMIITNDNQDDDSWDAIWEVRTRTDSLGWTAEFRIPLSALRFATDGDGVWGAQVVRMVQREREQSSWTPMRSDEPRIVSRFGELRGLSNLPAPRRLEMLPYTVSEVRRAPGDAANPFYSATDWRSSVGLDLKYGVTSNLTLDATINPDFGQVEADPSQVNLSAYESFYAEQRPFFTEGADIFRFGIALGDGDDANEQLFYSRRIGRAPQGGVSLQAGEYAEQPRQARILGAAKLSGRTDGGWSLGVMSAVTGEESARIASLTGEPRAQVVEPLTSYSVVRLRRDFNAGRTQIGGVGTGVVRRLDETGMDWLRSSALAGGMDFSHRFAGDRWMVSGSLLGSSIHGSQASILGAQRSAARYFQRPDAAHLRVDSSATSLQGWYASYHAAKIAGGKWRGGVLGQVRSPGFEVNDLGYQRNADQIIHAAYLGYREIQPGRIFRSYGVNSSAWTARNFGWEDQGEGVNVNVHGQLRSYWSGSMGVNYNTSSLSGSALRGGPALITPASYNGWAGVGSDSRKPLTAGANAWWRVEEERGGHSAGLSLRTGWRATGSTQLSVSPSLSLNRDGWQYVGQPADASGARHYLFGELEQRTFAVSLRANHTLTPELSLQLYAQPFVSAGRFSDFKEVSDPRASSLAERFREFGADQVSRDGDQYRARTGADARSEIRFADPDFNVRAMNLNAVARWEYRPGSTVYLVWSHGRWSAGENGQFHLSHDLDALFRERATNVFLIKANWWLSH